jgi:hypothetical protein
VFACDEFTVVRVMNSVVRRCFLLGDDPVTGKNYDHLKVMIECPLQRLAGAFGIDLLGFAVMLNHFDLILRSCPNVVSTRTGEISKRH